MRHKRSSRKPALRSGWNLPYQERHQRRLAIANLPGCRKFLQEFAAREHLDLFLHDGGRVWFFKKKGRRGKRVAIWKPYSAALKFDSRKDTFHCHDCFQVAHEIYLRLHAADSKTA